MAAYGAYSGGTYGRYGAPYGGDGAYEVYSGDRERSRERQDSRRYNGGGYGGDRTVRTDVYEYTTARPRRHEQQVVYGQTMHPRQYRESSSKYNTSSRRYGRDTNNSSSWNKYRNNRRDSTSSSSSSSDDDNREGFAERMGNKIKGVFGYGPDAANNNTRYGDNDRYTSSRRNKYDTSSYNNNSRYTTGGGYGSYNNQYDNQVVSLRGRRELAPSMNEESGAKQLMWQINTQGFDSDHIRVSDAGSNKIEISGQAEDVGQHHRRTKQFTRIITLPEGANAKEVKSRISGRGLLTITVPYTGTGLHNYGTRELQVGQGSLHTGNRLTGSTTNTGNTGYQQTTTTTQQRTAQQH